MRIEFITCPSSIEQKLQSKHNVTRPEAEQTLLRKPRIRFAEKGHQSGDDIYAAFGRTIEGRYLSIFFIYKPDSKTAIIISARDMTKKERKAYGRK